MFKAVSPECNICNINMHVMNNERQYAMYIAEWQKAFIVFIIIVT